MVTLAFLVLAAVLASVEATCSSTASTSGACGNNVCCPSGYCCSQYSYCGTTSAYCGAGCQSAFGTCTSSTTTAPTTTTRAPATTTKAPATTAAPTTTASSSALTWTSGVASCYGDYVSVLSQSSSSKVSSGITNESPYENWAYATAMSSPGAQYPHDCYAVKCVSGNSVGATCTTTSAIMVKVIDTLGDSHAFDLNNVAFNTIGGDGASCSGLLNIEYAPISCQSKAGSSTTNQIVKNDGTTASNPVALVTPNECDPWLPKFVFTNLPSAVYSVSAAPSGQTSTSSFTKQSGEWGAWTATALGGQWNSVAGGNALTFSFTFCSTTSTPGTCNAGGTMKASLAAGWCPNNASPCTAAYHSLTVLSSSDTSGTISAYQIGAGLWIGLALSFLVAFF